MAIKINCTYQDDDIMEANYIAEADIPLVHLINAVDNFRKELIHGYVDFLKELGYKDYLTPEELTAALANYTMGDLQEHLKKTNDAKKK